MTDYTSTTVARFLSDNVVTQFGFSKILMSDQGTHFVYQTIQAMIEEFQIQHKISTPYHLQANIAVEAFIKILENALTKVCNTGCDDWDMKIPAILWAYRMTWK